MNMGKNTHTVMPHNLAKALMEAGMQHFDVGGPVAPAYVPQGPGPATTESGNAGFLGSLFGQSKYNANLAPVQQTDYGNVINTSAQNALAGYGNSQNIQAQQQELANALLAQSQGNGPNPAQAQLAQSTGANVANQAALMASQRGAGSNVGLLARQAAQQGAGIQQNAAGQAATLQAQQQLAAQGALAQQQAAMASGNLGQQGLNAQLFGTGAGAQNAQNQANIANYGMVQGINSKVAENNAGAFSKIAGGLLGGAASALTGGLGGILGGGAAPAVTGAAGAAGPNLGLSSLGPAPTFKFAGGGKIPDHFHSVASIYHPEFAQGGSVDFTGGGPVPGQAQVPGNSIQNDTVPAMVSPGEVVLPRTVTQSADAPRKAADFVRHLQEKDAAQGGYQKIADSKKRRAA